jgi:hypothetical protein
MYPKYRVKQLIDKYAPYYIYMLGLQKQKITWHVLHTQSAERSFLMNKRKTSQDAMGESYINKDGDSDIVIYYDLHPNRYEVMCTIIHELLHVAFDQVTALVTIKLEKAHKNEELLVQKLERLLGERFNRKPRTK